MIYLVDTERKTLTAIGIIKASELRKLEAEAKRRGPSWEVLLSPGLPAMDGSQTFNPPVYPDPEHPIGFHRQRKTSKK